MVDIEKKEALGIKLLPDNKFIDCLKREIGAARKTILFSTFKLEIVGEKLPKRVGTLLEAIAAARGRGVEVKMLLNWRASRAGVPRTNYVSGRELMRLGCDVRYSHTGRCIHAKLCIIDGAALFIGSHNLSSKSFLTNCEASLFVKDEGIIRDTAEFFNRVFCAAKPL